MANIEHIKSAIDLNDPISESCNLDSSGRGAHENKHDSRSGTCLCVAQDDWYCHHCHAGGDVFNWIMDRDGVDFREALRTAAGIAGVPLGGSDLEAESEMRAVHDVLRAAAVHFHANLTDAHRADIAARWGITDRTTNDLLIGMAGRGGELEGYLHQQGFNHENMLKSGLFFDFGRGLMPHFRGRYVFPYWESGTVRYMIARQTPETPQSRYEKDKNGNWIKYKKLLTHSDKRPYVSEHVRNDTLYGVDSLRGAPDWCVITEGVTDCIMALQAGMPCISPVTTKFRKADRKRILKLVKRFATVYICNDSEKNDAGVEGAIGTAEYLESNGITTRLVTLPRPDGVGKIDLAEYLRDHDTEEFKALFYTAVSVWTVKLSRLPVSGDAVENVRIANRFITDELPGMDGAERVAFIGSDVKMHFGLSNDVVRELVKVAHAAPDPTTHHEERLVFGTDHLRNYQALDDMVALEGKDYTPFIKAVWYNVIGTLKAQPVRFGNITIDTRFNLFIPMPSGTGKNNIKQAISKIVSGCGKEVRSPTSFHPEQLIGKMIPEKFYNPDKPGKEGKTNDTRYIPNYGYLKKDSVIFDEAYHFTTRDDKQYDESKSYIRIALDPIGNNLIQKKLIDQLDVPEQRLEYHPRCTITMFLQPKGMDDDNVLTGFLRRFNIIYSPLVGKNLDRREEIIRYIKHPRPEVSLGYWKDIAEWGAPTYFDFEDEIDDLLVVLHDDLITYMRSLGEKPRNYLDRKAYSILDDLVGMAVVQAISRKSDVVTQQDVKLAYMDLFEFFKLTLDYIDAKVFGNLDYGEKWHGAEAKEIEALKWLADRGATDKDKSEVTVKEWIDCLSGLFEVGKEAARKYHKKLKNKRRLIDSKQVGRDSSRVWITFDPNQDTFDGDPVPLSDTLYWQIANGENTISIDTTLPPLPPIPLDSENGNTTLLPPSKIDGVADRTDGKGGKCDTTLKTIAGGMGGKGGRVVTEMSPNPIELAQQDRMKAIDRFFRDRNIAYANSEELTKFVPEIADKLTIGFDVAFRSVIHDFRLYELQRQVKLEKLEVIRTSIQIFNPLKYRLIDRGDSSTFFIT